MLTNVAVLAYEGVAAFELGLLCEAFGVDRTEDGVPALDFAVCGSQDAPLRTGGGFSIVPDHGWERVAQADLVGVPAYPPGDEPAIEVLEAMRAAHDRGARLFSVCSGAFALGAAGLLDDLDCTTHWRHAGALAARFPRARVIPEVLYVDAGQIVTSAGTAAGLDAALHIWRQEYGAAVASTVARRMVVPPQRDGGQAQFITRPVVDCQAETLGPLLTWITENLDGDLSVEALAARTHMSPRTFARRFRDETGATPHAWVIAQRLRAAEELLERTDRPVEWVAAEVGFGNAGALRQHFTRFRGVSPQQYRRTFAC